MNNNSSTNTNRRGIIGPTAAGALVLALLAGVALGQSAQNTGAYEVVVETTAPKPPPAPGNVAPTARQDAVVQSVFEVSRSVDGTTISVRRVNAEPIVVKLNGRVLDAGHYEIKKGVVVVTEPGTGKTHEIALPERPAVNAPMGVRMLRLQPEVAEMDPKKDFAVASSPPRVMLGVVMVEPDPVVLDHLGLDANKAVLLERVIEGLPAHKAGLQAKDIVVGFGENAEPRTADEIREVLIKANPGQKVKVRVIRKGEPVTMELKLEAYDASKLGRAGGFQGGNIQFKPGQDHLARWKDRQEAPTLKSAEDALKQAAEMLAQIQVQGGANVGDAHRQAVEAINKAIEAMRQGEAFGFEIEDMRRMQQEAIERLREGLAQGGANNRLWAIPGEPGQGFALTIPSPPSPAGDALWDERMASLEKRLADLESRIERSMQRLERQTEAMTERLLHRIERALQNRDGQDR